MSETTQNVIPGAAETTKNVVAAAAPEPVPDLAHEIAVQAEALVIREADAANWRTYALKLEACPGDAARLEWLERRIRACGPDLGYLLGLPQGWGSLRNAIDQARALGGNHP